MKTHPPRILRNEHGRYLWCGLPAREVWFVFPYEGHPPTWSHACRCDLCKLRSVIQVRSDERWRHIEDGPIEADPSFNWDDYEPCP